MLQVWIKNIKGEYCLLVLSLEDKGDEIYDKIRKKTSIKVPPFDVFYLGQKINPVDSISSLGLNPYSILTVISKGNSSYFALLNDQNDPSITQVQAKQNPKPSLDKVNKYEGQTDPLQKMRQVMGLSNPLNLSALPNFMNENRGGDEEEDDDKVEDEEEEEEFSLPNQLSQADRQAISQIMSMGQFDQQTVRIAYFFNEKDIQSTLNALYGN